MAPLAGISAFGVIALILATAGVFAVVAYAVIRRTRELAVRVAVGATARDLTRAIVPGIAAPIVAGLAVGLVAAARLASFIKPMLFYEVSPTSPAIYAAAAAAFLSAAAVAAWIPLRRAWRLDPALTLRHGQQRRPSGCAGSATQTSCAGPVTGTTICPEVPTWIAGCLQALRLSSSSLAW